MKILLATGIYPPQIGGPATQAKMLFERLRRRGIAVRVENFGDIGNWWRGWRHLIFFFRVWRRADKFDIIYGFDLMSVGLPCALIKLMKPKKKFIVRLGGDYGWEKAVQKSGYDNTLKQYYRDKRFGFSEKVVFLITNFVLRKADLVVFNASILRDVYVRYRGVEESKTVIVGNFRPVIDPSYQLASLEKKEIKLLFAGRIVAVKNLIRLIDAFALLKKESFLKRVVLEVVGDGPDKEKVLDHIAKSGAKDQVIFIPRMEHGRLLGKIYESDIAVLVSLTEIDSNFALEVLALQKPIVLTKQSESCYVGDKNALIYYVDPFNVSDIVDKIKVAIKDHVRI